LSEPVGDMSEPIVLRSVVSKSFLKATFLVAVFSVFLELGPGKIVQYLIFLVLYYAFVCFYAFSKWSTLQIIGEGGIVVKPLLRAERVTRYSDILDLSYAQGRLAKKFNCGTVFILLKVPGGKAKLFGGGSAELLRDVRDPEKVIEEISSRLSPYFSATDSLDDLR
jgi:hypothetical protein